MNLWESIRSKLSPKQLTTTRPAVSTRPLSEQFTRLGGGLTPRDVSWILAEADGGQPRRLVDLFQEARQKDGEIQACCGLRDQAVALCKPIWLLPEDATTEEKKAVDTCKRIVEDFENWPTMLDHLGSSYIFGHATSEVYWRASRSGLLLPHKAENVDARRFIFNKGAGALRYATSSSDREGIDLRAKYPGRIIQMQRRIVGDVPAREGLARLLIWPALFRNWTLTDWIALGEIGWKPWRIGKYEKGASQEDIDGLINVLDRLGSSGVVALPASTNLDVQWPKGISSGSMGNGMHSELYEVMAREMRKAVLGTTTSVDSTANGDRAATGVRDALRKDVHRRDAAESAACLTNQLFAPAIALNHGEKVRCPILWFKTEEADARTDLAKALADMRLAGVPIPVKWARAEFNAPEPEGDEETTFDVEWEDNPEDAQAIGTSEPKKPKDGKPAGNKPKQGK